MSSRARSKAYVPVLVQVCRYTASEKGIIVLPLQMDHSQTIHLPFKNQTVLLQHIDSAGLFVDYYDPAELLGEKGAGQRADLMMKPSVIAWVQSWLLITLEENEGIVVRAMTPPTPKAKPKVKS